MIIYLFLFIVVVVDNFEEEKFKIEKGASYIRIKESQLLLQYCTLNTNERTNERTNEPQEEKVTPTI